MLEAGIQHAVAVEVDLAPVGRLQEAVAVLRQQLAHAGVGQSFVALDVAALRASVIFQPPACGVEGLPNRRGEDLLLLVSHHQFPSGQGQIDADVEGPSLAMVADHALDNYLATYDSVVVAIEPGGLFPDLGLERFG